jgi:hypothetical protein
VTARRRDVDPLQTRAFTLAVVGRLGERRRTLETETREILLHAYATGVVSWEQLGAALGTTGSAAWHLAHPAPEEYQTGTG